MTKLTAEHLAEIREKERAVVAAASRYLGASRKVSENACSCGPFEPCGLCQALGALDTALAALAQGGDDEAL